MGNGTVHGEGECLAACDDQINQVSVTSSMFPNRETFVKREGRFFLPANFVLALKSCKI